MFFTELLLLAMVSWLVIYGKGLQVLGAVLRVSFYFNKDRSVGQYLAFPIVSLIASEKWQVTEVWIAGLHEQFL